MKRTNAKHRKEKLKNVQEEEKTKKKSCERKAKEKRQRNEETTLCLLHNGCVL
jgi:hypothetical protein